jgi:hypothetical protein
MGKHGFGYCGDAVSEREVHPALAATEAGARAPVPAEVFERGELVRVISGPIADSNGVVEEVSADRYRYRLRVAVLVFGPLHAWGVRIVGGGEGVGFRSTQQFPEPNDQVVLESRERRQYVPLAVWNSSAAN